MNDSSDQIELVKAIQANIENGLEKNNRMCQGLGEVTNAIMMQLENFNIQKMSG